MRPQVKTKTREPTEGRPKGWAASARNQGNRRCLTQPGLTQTLSQPNHGQLKLKLTTMSCQTQARYWAPMHPTIGDTITVPTRTPKMMSAHHEASKANTDTSTNRREAGLQCRTSRNSADTYPCASIYTTDLTTHRHGGGSQPCHAKGRLERSTSKPTTRRSATLNNGIAQEGRNGQNDPALQGFSLPRHHPEVAQSSPTPMSVPPYIARRIQLVPLRQCPSRAQSMAPP